MNELKCRLLIPTMQQFHLKAAGRMLIWALGCLFAYKVGRGAFLNAENLSKIDFYYFWDAAVQVLQGQASAVYAARSSTGVDLAPIGYPPPFLLVVAPLGLLPFGPALYAWLIITGSLYVISARQPIRLALVNPAAAYNGLFGQTGFLTSAILLFAANALGKRPLLSGVLFGCMVVKPHLALLVPLALIAGRHWSALIGSTVSAAILLALAAVAFGAEIYRAFLHSVLQYGTWLSEGSWPWDQLASPYAFLRWFGVDRAVAFGLHGAIAVCAALLVWKSWREHWESRIEILAAASVLGSPYLFTYDAVLLVAPFGFLAARKPPWALGMWALLFVPLVMTTLLRTSFLPPIVFHLPNTTPLAAVLSLFALYLLNRRDAAAQPMKVSPNP